MSSTMHRRARRVAGLTLACFLLLIALLPVSALATNKLSVVGGDGGYANYQQSGGDGGDGGQGGGINLTDIRFGVGGGGGGGSASAAGAPGGDGRDVSSTALESGALGGARGAGSGANDLGGKGGTALYALNGSIVSSGTGGTATTPSGAAGGGIPSTTDEGMTFTVQGGGGGIAPSSGAMGGIGGKGGDASLTIPGGNYNIVSVSSGFSGKFLNGNPPISDGSTGGAAGNAELRVQGNLIAGAVSITSFGTPANVGAPGNVFFDVVGTLTTPLLSVGRGAAGGAVQVGINKLNVPTGGSTELLSVNLGSGDIYAIDEITVQPGAVLNFNMQNSSLPHVRVLRYAGNGLNLTGGASVDELELTLPGPLTAGGTAFSITAMALTGTGVNISNPAQLQLAPGESATLLSRGVTGTLQSSTVTYGGRGYQLQVEGGKLLLTALDGPAPGPTPVPPLPQTGDNFPLGGLLVAMIAALGAMAWLGAQLKRNPGVR